MGKGTLLDWFERQAAEACRTAGVGRFVAPDRAVRALEFGLVGSTGAALNSGVFLSSASRQSYLVPGAIAFFVAVCWTFLLNRHVTFDRPDGDFLTQFARYLSVCACGYVLYASALTAAIEFVHLTRFVANTGALVVGGLWNFVGSERFALADGMH